MLLRKNHTFLKKYSKIKQKARKPRFLPLFSIGTIFYFSSFILNMSSNRATAKSHKEEKIMRKKFFKQNFKRREVEILKYIKDNETRAIGERIKRIRLMRNKSIEELSRVTRIPVKRLSSFEEGKKRPSTRALIKIAYMLGVETMALIPTGTTIDICAMYALFDMESRYGLSVYRHNGNYVLEFEDRAMNSYMAHWHDHKTDYEWKATFPAGMLYKG